MVLTGIDELKKENQVNKIRVNGVPFNEVLDKVIDGFRFSHPFTC